ncbi:MAG TPA: proline dehydrogenase, partial [Thalassospira sp.]|nr:proline dehydrogenase [Thalassospira sp.]
NQPLQRDLVSLGYRLRLYAPFGADWWAYAWRRVGENPRNLGLLLRSRLNATGL